MSSPSLSVSVIIITFNRREKLLSCLLALRAQTFAPIEVIVVIDGSTDDTARFLAERLADYAPLRVVSKPNEGRSLSRNLGAQKASGDILVFFDDDMKPYSECLDEHRKILMADINTISVGTQEDDPALIQNDFDRFRDHIARKWENELKEHKHKAYITGANFCISRQAFLKLNGFDPRAEFAEDADLGLRAAGSAMKIVYNPRARGLHDNRLDCPTYIRKQIEYYHGHLNLLSLHPEYSKGAPGTAVYVPDAFKKIVYSMLGQQFFIRLVDKGFFQYILPKTLRYKFYDVLITAFAKVFPSRFTLQSVRHHG